jgi:hypothetical protein
MNNAMVVVKSNDISFLDNSLSTQADLRPTGVHQAAGQISAPLLSMVSVFQYSACR